MANHGVARTNTANDDPAKSSKLAKRFNYAMTLALNPEPVHIDPRAIAISEKIACSRCSKCIG